MDNDLELTTIHFRKLLDEVKEAIFLLDFNDRILFMNSAAKDLITWADENLSLDDAHDDLLPRLFNLGRLPPNFLSTSVTLTKRGQKRFFELHQKPAPFPGRLLVLEEVTEQKQIAESLKLERSFINSLLDTMDILMVVMDPAGKIIRINRAVEQFFGFSKEELTNKFIWEFVNPQDEQVKGSIYANIQAGINPFQSIDHWITRDGTRKKINWSSVEIHDERNNSQYLIAFGIDITDLQRVENLLDSERSLLHNLINSIPDLVFYKDVHGVYQGWNKAFQAYRGTRTDTLKQNVTDIDIYPEDKAQQFLESDRKVLESGQPVIYENWTTGSNGKPVLLETKKTPYYGSKGELLGVIGISRDVTHHRLLENELRAANLEIEQLISSLSSALIAVTSDLKVTRWNPKAEMIFGKQADEVTGQALDEIGLSWDWNKIVDALSHCKREKRAVFMDPILFKRLDHSDGFLGVNISPIINTDQSLRGFIILLNDITERKLSEDRLTQTRRLESIGQLAAGIAHEINTPIQYIDTNIRFLQQSFTDLLNVTQGYQAILANAHPGEISPNLLSKIRSLDLTVDLAFLINEIPEAISQTLDGTQRVAEIVQAMKGFSHPGVTKKTSVNLNKCITDTLTIARNTWKYVADVEMKLDPNLPEVVCQPGEINQVFLNIIVNAADALSEQSRTDPTRKGIIQISSHQDGEWVEIRIADNGPGIPEEIRHRIFEPFFTTKDVGKGTGQGLAIAYDIVVNKHHGSLRFETTVGKGTTFIVRLPFKENEENIDGRENLIR